MRFSLRLKALDKNVDLDYRRKFLSMFKTALSDYDSDIFDKYYHEKDPIRKQMTFSPYFRNSKIKDGKLLLNNDDFILNLSVYENEMGIHFYNSLLNMKNKEFRDLFQIEKISLQREKKFRNEVIFKTKSPIIAKEHNRETNKDSYYSFEDDKFIEVLKNNLYNNMRDCFEWDVRDDIDKLEIEILSAKKIVVKNYGITIPCTLGQFRLKGENYLLDYFYKAGFSAKSSQGFGYVDVE
ncbi:CRISPR-associated Cas6 family protein [Hypnocyclicus thermotrophus]|uniref:CRISPR-associated Cas6 family protein n=1 Tax=Hypnocyclicus thermotrophus TaxID=1627895 RepID=A0AA46DWW3_9FUSO|nr:CRISPR-associated endoribonuclease Cas6 [Hypnocyclicus thermotrophus]TDT67023.1 CRISPR-associated Cas6 family protein [Hypnocyclicus thermotrophus]